MNKKEDINYLEQLLYNSDKDFIVTQLKDTDNSLLLHYFAANYNWNSGFDVPQVILENTACDLGTGLLMFYYADGYRLLEKPDEVLSTSLEDWKNFLSKVYYKLTKLEFQSRNISFDPQLTKIQKYKLKKNNPELPHILISKSPGEEVDIPKI
ncbi:MULTISPECIES: DUF4274 domain-containing protein [Bacillaceae]|uniref:DUF4274 domain-containing protein n=1 Tax=Evansella alkalicola TaxID=745819 RepID=A0ABS6K0P7_9BACI|nr:MULTISPECIES: DUF4274 domain-containing protein [Bacillaceae]MBU9723509.1 DUF4274 domain-containing protein [Bacillus alkalicola]